MSTRSPSWRAVILLVLLTIAVSVGATIAARLVLPAAGPPAGAPATQPAQVPGPADDGRAMQALAAWLNLTPQQQRELHQHDPTFASEQQALRRQLAQAQGDLAAAMEDPHSSDHLIMQRTEAVISAGAALQRRVARYLLVVRDHLTAAQRQQLFGLCAQTLRGTGPGRGQGGPGWGGGGQRRRLGPGGPRGH